MVRGCLLCCGQGLSVVMWYPQDWSIVLYSGVVHDVVLRRGLLWCAHSCISGLSAAHEDSRQDLTGIWCINIHKGARAERDECLHQD